MGRFAEAATAKARATRKAMFCPIAMMPRTMETSPMTTTVIRETRTCCSSVALPRLITLA